MRPIRTKIASPLSAIIATVTAISIIAIIFVLGPLAIGFAKTLFRRASRPGLPPQALTETAERLERLEGAVDSIAIEIERISEGQRFVTKLLSEGQNAPSLGAGQRAPDQARSRNSRRVCRSKSIYA